MCEGSITPWLGAKDSDTDLVYDEQHQWSAYDLANAQKLSAGPARPDRLWACRAAAPSEHADARNRKANTAIPRREFVPRDP
jgi:hypothetical protein